MSDLEPTAEACFNVWAEAPEDAPDGEVLAAFARILAGDPGPSVGNWNRWRDERASGLPADKSEGQAVTPVWTAPTKLPLAATSDPACDVRGCGLPSVTLLANDAPLDSPDYREWYACRWHERNVGISADALIETAIVHKQPDEVLHWGDEAWMACGCGVSIKLPVVERTIPGSAIKDAFAEHLRRAFEETLPRPTDPWCDEGGPKERG